MFFFYFCFTGGSRSSYSECLVKVLQNRYEASFVSKCQAYEGLMRKKANSAPKFLTTKGFGDLVCCRTVMSRFLTH